MPVTSAALLLRRGKVTAQRHAWLILRSDSGEERSVRKGDLRLAPAPTEEAEEVDGEVEEQEQEREREQEEQEQEGRQQEGVNDGDERSSCLRSAECSKPRGHRGFCGQRNFCGPRNPDVTEERDARAS